MGIRSFVTRCALLVVVVPLCFGCVKRAGGGGPNTDLELITREQIRELDVRTAYDAVERLRPRWLTVRGGPRSFRLETEIVVFQDEMYLGGTDALRNIGIDGIYTIRHLDGATASATLPGMQSRHVDGAIVISMRPPEN